MLIRSLQQVGKSTIGCIGSLGKGYIFTCSLIHLSMDLPTCCRLLCRFIASNLDAISLVDTTMVDSEK